MGDVYSVVISAVGTAPTAQYINNRRGNMALNILGGGIIDGEFGKDPDFSLYNGKLGRTYTGVASDNTLKFWIVQDFKDAGGVEMANGLFANPVSVAGSSLDNANVIKAILVSEGLSGEYGYFADGFTYVNEGDIGIDADGNSWIYVGAGAPNKVVPAGTVPSVSGGYEQVTFNSASGVSNANGGSVQDFMDNLSGSEVLDSRGTNVQAYIDGNLTPFKTVADMKAAAFLSTLSEGTRVEWQGYYSQSDGGSNWGVLRFGAHTEDGGSIFSIDANTYIEANLKGGRSTVLKFGAIGDGVHDNKNSFETAMGALGYILLPRAGSFFISQSVFLNDDVTLESKGASIISPSGSRLLSIGSGVTIKGVTFIGSDDGSENSTSYSIYAELAENIEVYKCNFINFANRPLNFLGCKDVEVHRNKFVNIRKAIGMWGVGIGPDADNTVACEGISIHHNEFTQDSRDTLGAAGVGISVPQGSGLLNDNIRIYSNKFENLGNVTSPRGDIDIYNDASNIRVFRNLSLNSNYGFFKANDVRDVRIYENTIKNARGATGIDVGHRYGATVNQDVHIYNNTISMHQSSLRGIRLFGREGIESKSCSIKNNTVKVLSDFGGIYCKYFKDLNVSHNNVEAIKEFGISIDNPSYTDSVGLTVVGNSVEKENESGDAIICVPRENTSTSIITLNRATGGNNNITIGAVKSGSITTGNISY